MRASAWVAVAILSGCGGSNSSPAGSGSGGASTHTLSIHIAGSGTVAGASFSCSADCQQSLAGTVDLTATAASGFTFSGWLGACSGASDCSLTVSADTDLTATFTAIPPPPPPPPVMRTLTVSVTGSGSVMSAPAGISCPGACSATFAVGTKVALTAGAQSGSVFGGWSGACSGSGDCAVTMSADASVSAAFNAPPPPPPPDECDGVMPGSLGTPVSGTVDFSGTSSKNFCDTAIADGHGDVAGLLSGMGPHPWTVWTASGSKSATHFNTNGVTAVGLDSGFMGQAYDGTQRIEEVWAADGSFVTKEQPSANDAMTNIETFPAATSGSVAVVVSCWSGIHMVDPGMSLSVFRFDGSGNRVSEFSVSGYGGCAGNAFAATVDGQDRTFVVFDTGPGNTMQLGQRKMMGRWIDRAGTALTDWFDTGAPETSSPVVRPLIGGGALVGAVGFQWLASVPKSGQTATAGAPSWATDGDDVAIVRGGKAYALVPQHGDTISIDAPSGKSCGNLQFAGAQRLQLGLLDGTVIDMGGTDGCSLRWWSGLLR